MATRAQQFEILAAGVIKDGSTISNPYVKFYAAGTTTPKDAYTDINKSMAITKKGLDTQGRAVVYGDGIYKLVFYSGDPDNGGTPLSIEIDNYKVTAVIGNTRTITAAAVSGSVDDSLVEADTSSNNITYTLPDAALMAGRIIQTAKSAAANTFTVAAASGQLVNGAASVAYTAQYSTGVFQSNGTNWYVFQTVGDATTLNTYEASLTAVAGTIPVYNGTPALVGNITGNAATATLATTATTATKHGVLNVKVVNIGDWNMDSTASVNVAHGLTSSKIMCVSVLILSDASEGVNFPVSSPSATTDEAVSFNGTNVILTRGASGFFDTTTFDATSFNRGYITIWYID